MTKQQLKESLNKLDHKALDECTKYYDLVALYESAKFEMSNNDFSKLESLIKESNSEKINNFMLNLLQEDFVYKEAGEKDNSELNLDRIFESEMLAEDKIVPEKCYAKESGKPYYSLKNITDDEYIQYGARTRYNSKARAAEKLRDLQSHVDGEYIDDSNIIKSDNKKTESLSLTEVQNNSGYTMTYEFGDTIIEDTELNREFLQFIKNPLKKHNTELQEQAKPLLLLYVHVYANGETSVPVEVLLKEAGVPNPERKNAANTWFVEYKILDLARKESDIVYPGKNLKAWVEGDREVIGIRHFRDGHEEKIGEGTGLTDLRPYLKEFKTRASQGLQPDRSHGKGDTKLGDKDYTSDSMPTYMEEPDIKAKGFKVNLDFFESLENDDLKEASDRLTSDLINTKRKTYREYVGLDEDAEITEDNLQDWSFKHMCSLHGWPFEETKKQLLGI